MYFFRGFYWDRVGMGWQQWDRIRKYKLINYIALQMDEQFENELQATKSSFYKLQQNFNHNLLVIQQLQQQNQKLLEQNENIKAHYHRELDEVYISMEELRKENYRLAGIGKTQVEKVRRECQEEAREMVEMMGEKMREERRCDGLKWAKEKKEAAAQLLKCEESLKHAAVQNSKLVQTIKQLRSQKQALQTQLETLLSQKQTYTTKLTLHQKQLQNMRNANEEWQSILKQKIKQSNKEKQKIEQELSETKLAFKMKLKSVKDQAVKKIQEVQGNKEKTIRLLIQESKEIKMRFDLANQELEKLRVEAKAYEKEKVKMEEKIMELSKQAGSEKQIEYLKKMFEQEKIQLKGENKLLENQKNQLKQELKQVNERREQVEKTLQRFKSAVMAAQKQVADGERKYRKLERETKQLRAEAKKFAENNNMNYRGFQSIDIVNQNPNTIPQQGEDYSKYFSEDMGPVDDMFLMENSLPRSPKAQVGPSPVNHQLMKKIGQLQVETDQYKNTIKMMSQEMQRLKSMYLDQFSMKDQQIKLGRDQVHLLREKINEREQQLLSLAGLRQQVEDKNRKIADLTQKMNLLQKELEQKSSKNQKLEAELIQKKQKLQEITNQLNSLEQQKKILDEINQELRSQVHQYKNRIRLYNQSEEENSFRADEDEFQDMKFDQSSSQQIIKKSQQFNRKSKSKSRSRSKSGNKTGTVHRGSAIQGNKASMKLKDLVLRKKQLQMEGKKINLEQKDPNSNKDILKTGTQSQKEIFEAYKRKSKQKEIRGERERFGNLRAADFHAQFRRDHDAEND